MFGIRKETRALSSSGIIWIRKMLLKCLVWLIVLKSVENHCHYIINQSNGKYDICLNDECHQIIDPISIEVKPLDCKTNQLFFKFSNYKTYQSFLNRMQPKIQNYFPSKSSNEQRLLRIYLLTIENDDKILDYDQLTQIGHHLDIYQLFILNLTETNPYHRIIHYDEHNSQWNIIQINFDCKTLVRVDENSCRIQIVPPSLFSVRRPSSSISNQTEFSSLSIEQRDKFKVNSSLILFISLPITILLISIVMLIIFLCKRCSKSESESEYSSSGSLSEQLNNKNNRKEIVAEAYQISRIPSPHKDSLYEHVQLRF